MSEVPVLSLDQARSTLASVLAEPAGGPWEPLPAQYENVVSCESKVFARAPDDTEVFVTRATSSDIPLAPSKIADTFWSLEAKWNSSSVAHVYQQHKTLSAACPRRDLVLGRSRTEEAGTIRIVACTGAAVGKTDAKYQTAEKGFCRAQVPFLGLVVEPLDGGSRCRARLVSCFDFGGWIHVKFVDAEKLRVAQRLSRVIGLSLEAAGIKSEHRAGPTPVPVSAGLPKRAPGSSYADYLASFKGGASEDGKEPELSSYGIPPDAAGRAAQADAMAAAPAAPAGGADAAAVGTRMVCSACKVAGEGRFCSLCGAKLDPACGSCLTPVPPGGRFCMTCGSKLL
eukprot:m51a1_g7216 hypothetical protein (341) ;mRNA; f:236886-238011